MTFFALRISCVFSWILPLAVCSFASAGNTSRKGEITDLEISALILPEAMVANQIYQIETTLINVGTSDTGNIIISAEKPANVQIVGVTLNGIDCPDNSCQSLANGESAKLQVSIETLGFGASQMRLYATPTVPDATPGNSRYVEFKIDPDPTADCYCALGDDLRINSNLIEVFNGDQNAVDLTLYTIEWPGLFVPNGAYKPIWETRLEPQEFGTYLQELEDGLRFTSPYYLCVRGASEDPSISANLTTINNNPNYRAPMTHQMQLKELFEQNRGQTNLLVTEEMLFETLEAVIANVSNEDVQVFMCNRDLGTGECTFSENFRLRAWEVATVGISFYLRDNRAVEIFADSSTICQLRVRGQTTDTLIAPLINRGLPADGKSVFALYQNDSMTFRQEMWVFDKTGTAIPDVSYTHGSSDDGCDAISSSFSETTLPGASEANEPLRVDLSADFAVDHVGVYSLDLEPDQVAVGMQSFEAPNDLRSLGIPAVQSQRALFWSLETIPLDLRCQAKFFFYDTPPEASDDTFVRTFSLHDQSGDVLGVDVDSFNQERLTVFCIEPAFCETEDEQKRPDLAFLSGQGLMGSANHSQHSGWLIVDDPETGFFQMIPGTPVLGNVPPDNWSAALGSWRSTQSSCVGSQSTVLALVSLVNNGLRCP